MRAANILISQRTAADGRVPRFLAIPRKRPRCLPLWVVLSDSRFRANRHGKHMSVAAKLIWNHIAHYEKTPLTRRPAK